MERKEEFELIVKIVNRAMEMDIMQGEKVTAIMDIENAHKQYGLRLEEFLNADEFNFGHDIMGIQNHMNRETKTLDDMFLPRFAVVN